MRTKPNTTALPRLSNDQFIFWLLWPFGALINALKNFKRPSSRTLFWLFCVYFGFVFVFADPYGAGGADSARYAAQLIASHNQPFSLNQLFSLFYSPEEGFADIYGPLSIWFVAIFTEDPRWLFALFAAVFGYFYANNIWIVLQKIPGSVGLVLFLYILTFALINPLWNINGVRMWTAAQVFLFGVLQLFLTGNKKAGWLWCISSVLFHFSFMFPLALLIAFRFIPKSLHLWFAFYFGATFINELNLQQVRDLLGFLPDVFQTKVQSYTNEAYQEVVLGRKLNAAWHVTMAQNFGKYILYAWVIILYVNHKKWFKDLPSLKNIFLFALFLGGWAQIASLVPSGGRFHTVANAFFYLTLILLLIQSHKKTQIYSIAKIIAVPLLFVIIFQIRVGFDYIGILTFAGNPLFAIFFESQTPLIDFVKEVF